MLNGLGCWKHKRIVKGSERISLCQSHKMANEGQWGKCKVRYIGAKNPLQVKEKQADINNILELNWPQQEESRAVWQCAEIRDEG